MFQKQEETKKKMQQNSSAVVCAHTHIHTVHQLVNLLVAQVC